MKKTNNIVRDSSGRFIEGIPSHRRKSYIGCQFGYLTVLDMEYTKDSSGKPRAVAVCKCECGQVVKKKVDSIKNSKLPNCGCMRKTIMQKTFRKDLTDQNFGRLKVLEMLWDRRPTKCRCLCDCGNICEVAAVNLTSGKTRSCGCLQRDSTSDANQKDFSGIVTSSGVEFIERDHKNSRGCWEWVCKCPCGNYFVDIPARVTGGHRTSCGCNIQSAGERTVESIIKSMNFSYRTQYTFPDCKYKKHLRFDFAILNKSKVSLLIEYDGQLHYKSVEWFGGQKTLEETQKRDKCKNQYCLEKNIPLLRLPYTLSEEEMRNKIVSAINNCESVETAGFVQ